MATKHLGWPWLVGSMGVCLMVWLWTVIPIVPAHAHAANSPPPPAPTPTPLNQVDVASLGKRLTVEGTIVSAEANTSGFRLQLSDGQHGLAVLIRDEDFDGVPGNTQLNVGATLRATGKLTKNNRGQLQLVPSKGKDVAVLSTSTSLPSRAKKYNLGAMNGNDHGALVLVEGKVIESRAAPAGHVFILQDGTGAQPIVLPRVVARHVAADLLRLGQSLRILGRVRATRHVGIEIVVALPADMQSL